MDVVVTWSQRRQQHVNAVIGARPVNAAINSKEVVVGELYLERRRLAAHADHGLTVNLAGHCGGIGGGLQQDHPHILLEAPIGFAGG